MRTRSRGAALGWFGGFTYIVDASVRTIPAHNKDVVVLLRRADPNEFPPIELNLLSRNNLVHIYGRTDGAESQPVRFGDVVNIISRNHPARPRHILHDDAGVAGDVLSHMVGDEARPKISNSPRRGPRDEPYGLSLVERRLRIECGAKDQIRCKEE
jgi:hypothetical protein